MSHHAIDFHTVLHAAEIIRPGGDRAVDDYIFEGLRLNTGFDGYSMTVANRDVSLTINFHNTFHLDSLSRDKTDDFYKHLQRIVREAQS